MDESRLRRKEFICGKQHWRRTTSRYENNPVIIALRVTTSGLDFIFSIMQTETVRSDNDGTQLSVEETQVMVDVERQGRRL
jgi:hypothetical protein